MMIQGSCFIRGPTNTPRMHCNFLMKILIIDDEKDIGFILGFELQSLGHQTVS
jgi:hypothetical protein